MPGLTRRTFLASAFAGTATPLAAAGRRLPNIVVILADDLGYGDLGCYNPASGIPTPNLDKLAASGVRFTDAHTPSAVCTPTRYGLLTGRYCWRTPLTSGVLDGFDPPLIDRDRLTVPRLLRHHGYSTACFGKWHLGMNWTTTAGGRVPRRTANPFRPGDDVDFQRPITGGPRDAGFDWYFGISASLDMPPYSFIQNEQTVGIPDQPSPRDMSLFMNQPPGVRSAGFRLEDVMPAITARTCEYIAGRKDAPGPFFLYMPLTAPHLPIVPNEKYKGASRAGRYGDFVVEVDECVGKVMQSLRDAGQAANTLVLFTSDNGGLWHWWKFEEADDAALGKITPRGENVKEYGHQSNAGLRGTKADIWEGGHRVPFLAAWPGVIKPGGVSPRLIGLNDLMATCAGIVGTDLPVDAGEDSISFLPALRDPGGATRVDMVLHSLQGDFGIRHGDWKLAVKRGSGGFSVPRQIQPKDGEPAGQLYNLRTDPRETRNVYNDHPDVVARLTRLLTKYQTQGRSRPPWPVA